MQTRPRYKIRIGVTVHILEQVTENKVDAYRESDDVYSWEEAQEYVKDVLSYAEKKLPSLEPASWTF